MATIIESSTVKSHMSLNVADLATSIEFYRTLFGLEPAKCHPDYAKFELDKPPLVFSIQPGPRLPGASLSHIGLRFTSEDAVFTIQDRLRAAGIPFARQENVVCGYARQSKCWVSDPDNNYWEIYVLQDDLDPGQVRACLTDLVPATTQAGPSGELPHDADDPASVIASGKHVLYKGPFRTVTDSGGRVYRRGERTPVSHRAFNDLRQGPLAECFLFAAEGAVGTCGGDNQTALASKN